MAGIDSYTVLMLHCDGADGSTTFTDSRIAPVNTMTANGSMQIDTAQSKFGGASGYWTASSSDYLTTPDSADWDFGTGDFTIDFWLRFDTVGSILLVGRQTSNQWYFEYNNSTGSIRMLNGGGVQWGKSWSPSNNTWYHIALTRDSGTNRIFIDGTQLGTNETYTGDMSGDSGLKLCGNGGVAGWMDEIRISKGIARWTSNFTPPTSAYSGIGLNTQAFII